VNFVSAVSFERHPARRAPGGVRHCRVRKLALLALGSVVLSLAARCVEHAALFVGLARADAQAPFAAAPVAEPSADRVTLLETRRVVPSTGLPAEVQPMPANNNLDVVRHSDGRVYLAFRSAPTHFAGPDTLVYVVSSTDERSWKFEARFAAGTDLREPRLLSLGSRLFLYVSKLGQRPYAFEPQGVWMSERTTDAEGARWGELEALDLPDHIVWRTKTVNGRGWMSAYRGGANLYRFSGDPLAVGLFTSSDGRRWLPADPEHPYVYEGGVSEAEFEFAADGSLLAVGRNEAGDERNGFGSVVCQAPPEAPARWTCSRDARKFDSPLIFSQAGEMYLVARRTANGDGAYDRGFGFGALRSIANQLDYITTAKRCSLFHYLQAERRWAFTLDLPSRGDTCFAGALKGDHPDEVVLYDYSSDIDGPDVAWSVGQRRPTYVYRHVLRFRPSEAWTGASSAEPSTPTFPAAALATHGNWEPAQAATSSPASETGR
jgi:hypothetical protein